MATFNIQANINNSLSSFDDKQDKELNKILKQYKILNTKLYNRIRDNLKIYMNKDGKIENKQKVKDSISNFIRENLRENYQEFNTIQKSFLKNIYYNSYYFSNFTFSDELLLPYKPELISDSELEETYQTGDDTGIRTIQRVNKNKLITEEKLLSSVNSGIALGLTVGAITKNIKTGIESDLYTKNRMTETKFTQMRNDARTRAMEKLTKQGVGVKKVWNSTLDDRTRDAHRALDQQIRPLNEPFEVSGAKGMEPGKMSPSSNNFNCRCRKSTKLDEKDLEDADRRFRELRTYKTQKARYQTYKEYQAYYKIPPKGR